MDTSRSEEALSRFESEIDNLSRLKHLISSIESLQVQILSSTDSIAQTVNTFEVNNDLLRNKLEEFKQELEQNKINILSAVDKSTFDFAQAINEMVLKVNDATNCLKDISESNKNKVEEIKHQLTLNLSSTTEQLVKHAKFIEDTLDSRLHTALTKYEIFVRNELSLLKDRLDLDFKKLDQSNNEAISKLNTDLSLKLEVFSKNYFKYLSILAISFVVSIIGSTCFLIYFIK
jgi:hypothetical protein